MNQALSMRQAIEAGDVARIRFIHVTRLKWIFLAGVLLVMAGYGALMVLDSMPHAGISPPGVLAVFFACAFVLVMFAMLGLYEISKDDRKEPAERETVVREVGKINSLSFIYMGSAMILSIFVLGMVAYGLRFWMA